MKSEKITNDFKSTDIYKAYEKFMDFGNKGNSKVIKQAPNNDSQKFFVNQNSLGHLKMKPKK